MGRFKIGDLAILAHPVKLKHLKGEEVEVIGEERERQIIELDNLVLSYEIQILKNGMKFFAEDNQLKPLDDPNTPCSWKHCLWKPKELANDS